MNKMRVIWLGIIVFLFLIQTNVFAEGKPIKKGDKFPEFQLSTPKDPNEQAYLGIKGKDTFSISDIQTEVVIIEIFRTT
jgi:hypothetical protein